MQNSSNVLNLETIFQSHFQGQCFVEHILGNAGLGRRGGSREGMIMHSVMSSVTFPLRSACRPGLPFMSSGH